MVTPNTSETLALDASDEFEGVVMEIVKLHRQKAIQYGAAGGDPLQNFYDNSAATGLSPRTCCEVLLGKHASQIKKYLLDGVHTAGTDDAYHDRAVYSILALILYMREGHA